MQRRRHNFRMQLLATTIATAWLGGGMGTAAAGDGPLGRLRHAAVARPAASQLWGCTVDDSVCLHGPMGAGSPSRLAETLQAAEAILSTYVALGLPRPLTDDWRAGTAGYDLYLDSAAAGATTHLDGPDPTASFDRASAFSILPSYPGNESCESAGELARVLGEAILLRLDAGAHAGVLAMQSSYLATLAAPCPQLEAAAVDDFQQRPELPLTAPRAGMSGALLFPAYLDHRWGTGQAAAVMTALLSIGPQHTAPDAERYSNEPDVFDSLRRAAQDRRSTLGSILLDFATARAFVGSRSDGGHLPDSERFGEFGRPRFEWAVPWDSLPRRLGPLRGIHPTGATYLWLDLTGAPAASRLRFVADWEPGMVFRWALVKVDGDGREAGRLVPPGVWGNHEVHLTVANLDELAGILVVGTNLGSDDRSHPFDPDDGVGPPALYGVTLSWL